MQSLLVEDELPAVSVRDGDGPFVIACEHASKAIPQALSSLGLTEADLDRHIAWDPGALKVAEGLAGRFDGALVAQRYSRLVVDCNRDPVLPDAIAAISEDTPIPGNIGLSPEAKSSRIRALWEPFHAALDRLLVARSRARRKTALVTVHSFTPVYRGISRPWHAGIISTDERSFSDGVLAALRREASLIVGDDQPYSARDNVDYTIRRHGRDRGIPHVMIEIRNDLLRTGTDVGIWVRRLSDALVASAAAIGIVPARVEG